MMRAGRQRTDGARNGNDAVFIDRDSVLIGTDIDTQEQIRLPFDDWYSHVHTPGAPGTGKSSFLELLCRQLIMLCKGLTVIDPLGVLVFRLLVWLSYNPQYAERVLLVSPYTAPHYAGYNPLKRVDYIRDPIVHSAYIADAIKKAFRDDGNLPLLTRKIEEAAEPLIMDNLTMLEMPYFYRLSTGTVRAKLIEHSRGDGVREEWKDFERLARAQQRDELGSLRNRLPRIVRNHFLRMTMGRSENTLGFGQVVEDNIVLLVDTSPHEGIMARDHSFIAGSLFLGGETSYMRTRSQLQANDNPRWTVIDEFQNTLSPEISASLDELRNFGWRSVLSHQRFGQLLREDRDILDAVNVDCGIKAVFGRLSPDALRILEPLVFLGEHDLHTEKYRTYAGQEAIPHHFSLQELRYQREVELYRQPRQHMTWKVLEQPPRRVKIADVQPFEYDHERFRAIIDAIIRNHSQYYLHEDEIREIIAQRHEQLESQDPDTDEPTTFHDDRPLRPRRTR